MVMLTFSGCHIGEGTPSKYFTGRRQTYKSNSCRKATFKLRIPPPTGVVSGPFILSMYSLKASIVASGIHAPVALNAFSPANTSSHSIFFSPLNAFCTAASNTLTLAFQISGPIPSPSINGMIGWLGTCNLPLAPMVIFSTI